MADDRAPVESGLGKSQRVPSHRSSSGAERVTSRGKDLPSYATNKGSNNQRDFASSFCVNEVTWPTASAPSRERTRQSLSGRNRRVIVKRRRLRVDARAVQEGSLADTDSAPRRLKVEDFFDQVIAEVPDLPSGLADRLRAIVNRRAAGAHASLRKAIEEATREE